MSNRDEQIFTQGQTPLARRLVGQLLSYLPENERQEVSWQLERAEIVAQLRSVCGYFGDNDWDDTLHLADVIGKHLANYLHENFRRLKSKIC